MPNKKKSTLTPFSNPKSNLQPISENPSPEKPEQETKVISEVIKESLNMESIIQKDITFVISDVSQKAIEEADLLDAQARKVMREQAGWDEQKKALALKESQAREAKLQEDAARREAYRMATREAKEKSKSTKDQKVSDTKPPLETLSKKLHPAISAEGTKESTVSHECYAQQVSLQEVKENLLARNAKLIERLECGLAPLGYEDKELKEEHITGQEYQVSSNMTQYLTNQAQVDMAVLDKEFSVWRSDNWRNLRQIPDWLQPYHFCWCLLPSVPFSKAGFMVQEATGHLNYRRMLESRASPDVFTMSALNFIQIVQTPAIAPALEGAHLIEIERHLRYIEALAETMKAISVETILDNNKTHNMIEASIRDFNASTTNKVEQIVKATEKLTGLHDDKTGSVLKGASSFSDISTGSSIRPTLSSVLKNKTPKQSKPKDEKSINDMF